MVSNQMLRLNLMEFQDIFKFHQQVRIFFFFGKKNFQLFNFFFRKNLKTRWILSIFHKFNLTAHLEKFRIDCYFEVCRLWIDHYDWGETEKAYAFWTLQFEEVSGRFKGKRANSENFWIKTDFQKKTFFLISGNSVKKWNFQKIEKKFFLIKKLFFYFSEIIFWRFPNIGHFECFFCI